jgi:hypothetical protein
LTSLASGAATHTSTYLTTIKSTADGFTAIYISTGVTTYTDYPSSSAGAPAAKGELAKGVLAGIMIGAILLLMLLIGASVVLYRQFRKKEATSA